MATMMQRQQQRGVGGGGGGRRAVASGEGGDGSPGDDGILDNKDDAVAPWRSLFPDNRRND